MRVISIASGSSGNVCYAEEGGTAILIDAGVSCKRIEDGLRILGRSTRDLSAVLITHEHTDHWKGLQTLLKKTDCPVYMTRGTYLALEKSLKSDLLTERRVFLQRDEEFSLGTLHILSIPKNHDAADPVAFRIEGRLESAAVVTDLGSFCMEEVSRLQNLDYLLLEANHDEELLMNGPYPYSLKRRILGPSGHLSNTAAGELLSLIMSPRLKSCLLGHLSEENNLPERALLTVRKVVEEKLGKEALQGLEIRIALRDDLTFLTEEEEREECGKTIFSPVYA